MTKFINEKEAREGEKGEKLLVSGSQVSLRSWIHSEPKKDKKFHTTPYETVGYVIEGKLRVQFKEGSDQLLMPGDSWVVPEGSEHRYEILEPSHVVEAINQPQQ